MSLLPTAKLEPWFPRLLRLCNKSSVKGPAAEMKFLSDSQFSAQHEKLRRTIKTRFQISLIFKELLGELWNPYFITIAETKILIINTSY